jgi:hypothetical protein
VFGNIGDTAGKVQAVSANGTFTITANETCHLSLVSANGGLRNNQYPTAAKIAYKAVVYDENANKTAVDVATGGTAFSPFSSTFDPVKLSTLPINFEFKIDGGGSNVVAAGNYEDTLTLKLDPTI